MILFYHFIKLICEGKTGVIAYPACVHENDHQKNTNQDRQCMRLTPEINRGWNDTK